MKLIDVFQIFVNAPKINYTLVSMGEEKACTVPTFWYFLIKQEGRKMTSLQRAYNNTDINGLKRKQKLQDACILCILIYVFT
jgi:hypothetical protein